MKGNRTNHPPREGVKLKPSKGGRTKRHNFAMTPEAFTKMQADAKVRGISLNDWLDEKIKSDIV